MKVKFSLSLVVFWEWSLIITSMQQIHRMQKEVLFFLDEIRFDILSRGESLRDRNLMKN